VESAAAIKHCSFQIGERKRAEDHLQQLNNELERRGIDGTRDLLKAIADLARTLEEGSSYRNSYGSRRRWRVSARWQADWSTTSITFSMSIQGYASLIMEHPDDPAWVIEVGGVVVRTVNQGAALARQLLTIARRASRSSIRPTSTV